MSIAMKGRSAWIMLVNTAVSVRLEKPEIIVTKVRKFYVIGYSFNSWCKLRLIHPAKCYLQQISLNWQVTFPELYTDAASKMSTFQETMEDMVPVLTPYKILEQPTKVRCAIWCQQEVDCVTFAARPLPNRKSHVFDVWFETFKIWPPTRKWGRHHVTFENNLYLIEWPETYIYSMI